MRQLVVASEVQVALAALDRATREDGPCSLDEAVPAEVWRRALVGPAEDFLVRPGKCLRSTIVHAGWVLGGGVADRMPERLALIIELLHAGSLIIDDIQDASLLRRGAPALHHVIGMPLAINTGSWMYFWALAEITELGLSPATELAIQRAATSTLVRCHQGQALDLATRVTEHAIESVAPVVEVTTTLKTGALCKLAAQLGALAAGAPAPVIAAMARFGECVGIALQMLDDLGALTSPARREKGREDLRAGRPTWPWAWLAREDAAGWSRCAARAHAAASSEDTDALAAALVVAIGPFGRRQIRTRLDTAIADLAAVVDDRTTMRRLTTELRHMEASYG